MKREDNIGGSIMGSPVYMAPEVLVSKGIYDRKVDIYALGIVLWEMWYGIDAAEHIQSRLSTSIATDVDTDGMRPFLTLSHKPDERWQGLITACWDKNPESRPDATCVETFFEQFLRFIDFNAL
jgi:serine/threonine protein kinase